MTPINVADWRTLAKRRLPKMVFDYLDGGAEDEAGLRHNREAFEQIRFQPRRLVDVSQRDTGVDLLGTRLPLPMVIAPTGLNGLLWPDGDLALARAARRCGIPFALSTASNADIETVARCGGDLWFQLYVVHRRLADQLVGRALDAGYSTLILTTDVTVNGKRERDRRNRFALPIRYTPSSIVDGLLHPRWSMQLVRNGVPQLANFATAGANDLEVQAALMSRQMDASFDWNALSALRRRWPHRLLVKGLIHPADAARCLELGADGVILSNHGGRQLDGAASPIETLPTIANAAPGRVLVDSGIRRGADVVKALALGASAVLLGRATLYGLAAKGEEGVVSVIKMLQEEIDITLAQLGCARADTLGQQWLVDRSSSPDRGRDGGASH